MTYEELSILREQLKRMGFKAISDKDLDLCYLLIFDREKGMEKWEKGYHIDTKLGHLVITLSIIAQMFQYKTIKTFARVIDIVIKHGVDSVHNLESMTNDEVDKLPVLNEIADIVVKERGHLYTKIKRV